MSVSAGSGHSLGAEVDDSPDAERVRQGGDVPGARIIYSGPSQKKEIYGGAEGDGMPG